MLIFTNLSWIRNPYQSEVSLRPNPNYFHNTIFDFRTIQTLRHLTEQEVREINFIIKNRAFRYIAASEKEWLFPEKFISKSNWHDFGNGYLLMPDPRGVSYRGEIMFGNKYGPTGAFDAYGRTPDQREFNKELNEFDIQQKFKGEFANIFGPYRRGRSFDLNGLDDERDSEDMHNYNLNYVKARKLRQKGN